jgi:hypothetical protein
MTITKSNYLILKNAALYASEIEKEIFLDRVKNAIETTETAAADASAKTTAYILEKRKTNKNYCR